MHYLMRSYGRLPVKFSHGSGAWLWDTLNNKYLDALCGIAVTGLGHAHPEVNDAVTKQIKKLSHVSNLYEIPEQELIARRLCDMSGMSNAFFCNSGSEANEAAIKIGRLFGHRKGIEAPAIIVMTNAWHGRTLATLTATGSIAAQEGFGPLVPGFIRAPFGNSTAIEGLAKSDSNIVGVLVEPIQGEAGIIIPEKNYLRELKAICEKNDWLLMLDEVQTGIGRTGRWFAYQHTNIMPDVLTLAKGLGNGFPIGACLARGRAAEVFSPGTHGSTFGGNPVGCAAALATISVIDQKDILQNVKKLGDFFQSELTKTLKGENVVKQVRVHGLMIGIELTKPCGELVGKAIEKRLLINVTNHNTIRLLPPLILDESQAMSIVESIRNLIRAFSS